MVIRYYVIPAPSVSYSLRASLQVWRLRFEHVLTYNTGRGACRTQVIHRVPITTTARQGFCCMYSIMDPIGKFLSPAESAGRGAWINFRIMRRFCTIVGVACMVSFKKDKRSISPDKWFAPGCSPSFGAHGHVN